MSTSPTFREYLEAKRALDDRSLNPRVLAALRAASVPGLSALDLGCGLGGTLERLIRTSVLRSDTSQCARYTGVDRDGELIRLAEARAQDAGAWVDVRFTVADALELGPLASDGPWSLMTAHAFLDLLDLDEALAAILPHLAPGGLVYFTLNFDDLTAIEPTIDTSLDESIVRAYHACMYAERWGSGVGERRSGRRLFHALLRRGVEILEMGPSDWVIAPIQGHYRDADAVVLAYLLTHIEQVVRAADACPDAELAAWFAERRRQLQRAELVYIAHQMDILGQKPPVAPTGSVLPAGGMNSGKAAMLAALEP